MLGNEVAFHQVPEVPGAPTGDGHRLFELAHDLPGGSELRFPPGDLGLDAGELRPVFAILPVQHARLLRQPLGRHAVDAPEGGRPARGERRKQRTGPRRLESRCGEIVRQPRRIGQGIRRIQLDQRLARPDGLPVRHADRFDGGRLDGLDHLGAFARDDPAAGRGHHVDLPEHRPGERDEGEGQQQPHGDARRRGDGGFPQRQGRGQELRFVGQAGRCVEALPLPPGVAEYGPIAAEEVQRSPKPQGDSRAHASVVPAHAGTQCRSTSRWIPAFAGMTFSDFIPTPSAAGAGASNAPPHARGVPRACPPPRSAPGPARRCDGLRARRRAGGR